MGLLISIGANAVYWFSVIVMAAGLFGVKIDSHVHFESAAVIITLVKVGKYLEARQGANARSNQESDEVAGQNRALNAAAWRLKFWLSKCALAISSACALARKSRSMA